MKTNKEILGAREYMNVLEFELFNTETEEVESGIQKMTPDEAESRNQSLCNSGDPQRWVFVQADFSR